MTTHDDDGAVIGDVVLCWESGGYGVDVSGGVWCMVGGLVLGSVVFECEEGAFVVHEVERGAGTTHIMNSEEVKTNVYKILCYCTVL